MAGSSQSQGQILSWFPVVLEASLGLSSSQVVTYALQVYIPDSYTSTADVDQLRTTWTGYIPSDSVDTLAQLISAKSSAFYTSTPDPYHTLAEHVDPSFTLDLVQNPSSGASTGSSSSSDSSTVSTSSDSSRQDAIIGVVSALGGVTLIIIGVLVFRSVKRRKEMAHRRLSDQAAANTLPYGDRAGRDFDQDSVGGQRRRSFYFAEDSLRGASQPADPQTQAMASGMHGVSETEYSYRNSPEQMRERRPVMAGQISAPILQQSSMNW